MYLSAYLKEEMIELDLKSTTKTEVINELVSLAISDEVFRKKIVKKIVKREEEVSTAIGHNIAIPHVHIDDLGQFVVVMGISRQGIEFDDLTGCLTHIFILIIGSSSQKNKHLRLLARIAHLAKKRFYEKNLMNATSKNEFIELIRKEE